MKRLFAILLAGTITISLAACQTDSKPEANEENVSFSENNMIESMTLIYGSDENRITVFKPQDASFDSPDQDGTALISLISDDMSWVMDIMSDFAYDDRTGQAFVSYYYFGALDDYYNEEYSSYEQTVTDLGIEYMGKPVKRIESKYVEKDYNEEGDDIFIGIEYTDTVDGKYNGQGLLGFQLSMYDETPSDEEYIRLFTEVFGLDK